MRRREFLGLLGLTACDDMSFLAQQGILGFPDKFGLKVLCLGDSIFKGNSDALGPYTRAKQWDDTNSQVIAIDDNDILEAQSAGGSQWPQFANVIFGTTGQNTLFCNCAISGSGFRYDPDTTLSWYTGHDCWTNAVAKARRWLNFIGRRDPDIVMLGLGINDANKSPITTTLADMQSLIDRINTEYNTPRIFITQPNATSTLLTTYELNNNLATIREYIKNLADNNSKVEVCFHLGLLPYFAAGTVKADGVHLTATGNDFLASRLARQVSLKTGFITNKIARGWISMCYFLPSTTRQTWMNDFAIALQAGGYWERLDALHFTTNMGSTDPSNGHKTANFDWAFKSPGGVNDPGNDLLYDGFHAVLGNNDNWNEGQYTYVSRKSNLASDFVNGAFIGSNGTGSGTVAAIIGLRESVAGGIVVLRHTGGGALEWCAGDGTVDSNATEGAFASNAHYWVARSAATGTNIKHLGKNGSIVSSVSRNSLAMSPGANIRAARYTAFNNNGTLANYWTGTLRATYLAKYSGWDSSGFNTLVNAFLANWLTNVP